MTKSQHRPEFRDRTGNAFNLVSVAVVFDSEISVVATLFSKQDAALQIESRMVQMLIDLKDLCMNRLGIGKNRRQSGVAIRFVRPVSEIGKRANDSRAMR